MRRRRIGLGGAARLRPGSLPRSSARSTRPCITSTCCSPCCFWAVGSLSSVLTVHQVNLQTLVGGGEYYTRAFSRALLNAGAKVRLHVHRNNRFWDSLSASAIDLPPVAYAPAFTSAPPNPA